MDLHLRLLADQAEEAVRQERDMAEVLGRQLQREGARRVLIDAEARKRRP